MIVFVWRLQKIPLLIFTRENDLLTMPDVYNIQGVFTIDELTLVDRTPHCHWACYLKNLDVTIIIDNRLIYWILVISASRSIAERSN